VISWFRTFAFKCNLYRYRVARQTAELSAARAFEAAAAARDAAVREVSTAGLCTVYKLNHSLQAPGYNPWRL
jgi:hypothetical protein